MKKYKITKYVTAERMFQSNAEQIIGPIKNLTHGNDGYLVEDKENGVSWMPKSVFEKMAEIADGRNDKIRLMISEAEAQLSELKRYLKEEVSIKEEREMLYTAIRRVKTYIKDLNKLLSYQAL